jgi:hypothetical protein
MTETPEYPLPTVHMNGTGKQSLLSDYEKVADRLDELLEAFQSMHFHPRDYYVGGDEAFRKAMNERSTHAIALNQFHAYIMAHLVHLNNQ